MNNTVISEEDDTLFETKRSLETIETKLQDRREKAKMHNIRISQKVSTV